MSEEHPKHDSQPEGNKKGFRGPHPDVGKATRIKPGEVRNPEGKNGQDFITSALKNVFGDAKLTEATIRKILKGKSAMAIVMLLEHAAERIEGKVAQPVKVTGDLTVSLANEIREARERAERLKESS